MRKKRTNQRKMKYNQQKSTDKTLVNKLRSFFKRDDCIFIILIVSLLPFLTINHFRIKKEMHDNSVLLKAEVVDMYHHNTGLRYKPTWRIRFEYEFQGQFFSSTNSVSEKLYDSINIGDTIDVLVSVKNPKRHAFWIKAKNYLVLPSQYRK